MYGCKGQQNPAVMVINFHSDAINFEEWMKTMTQAYKL